MASAQRIFGVLLCVSLLVVGSGPGVARSTAGPWEETRFRTGCDPGPYHAPAPPEHRQTRYPGLDDSAEPATLHVDLASTDADDTRAIVGSGFNFEHGLWSCPAFRGLLRTEILDPFKPAIARINTGLLPAAPSELAAHDLGPAVYESVLSSGPYADSWAFFRRLNRAGVKIILGVWGGPAQFTLDGTR